MPLRRSSLLLAALLGGCLSGTETGNPEIMVTASFGITGGDSSVSIASMDLMVMGVKCRRADDTVGLWDASGGTMVDLASPADSGLPPVKMPGSEWMGVEVMLDAPHDEPSLPDTFAFSAFSNPRYVKMIKVMGGEPVRILFELPADLKIVLGFGSESVAAWRNGNRTSIRVMFDCNKWATAIPGKPAILRKDGKGEIYYLLNPGENGVAYDGLLKMLPMSFLADWARML